MIISEKDAKNVDYNELGNIINSPDVEIEIDGKIRIKRKSSERMNGDMMKTESNNTEDPHLILG